MIRDVLIAARRTGRVSCDMRERFINKGDTPEAPK